MFTLCSNPACRVKRENRLKIRSLGSRPPFSCSHPRSSRQAYGRAVILRSSHAPLSLVRSRLLLQINHRLSETDVRHHSIRNIPHSSRTPDPASDRKVLMGRGVEMSSKLSRRRNEIADEIGDGLRAIYDGVLHERLPDRFSELLDQLDRGELGGASKALSNSRRPDQPHHQSKHSRNYASLAPEKSLKLLKPH